MTKYIFVTGGVVSSLGKGIASASIGKLLESRGLKISIIKCDPYINVDPGTMNPYQHGEVYVTDDGAETDLDLGHYERFTNARLGRENNITTGKVYHSVIMKERRGEYLGNTVQVIPHITDEIKSGIRKVARTSKPDILIVEIGGTVGDIEGLPYLEAIRQFSLEEGRENVVFIHLTLIPYIRSAGEIKTKPTQHSVQKLREIGIQADILLCRSEFPISKEAREKIALFCNMARDMVFQAIDVETVYEIPLIFGEQGLDTQVLKRLGIKAKKGDLGKWQEEVVDRIKSPKRKVKIAVVGKYITLQDAYKSIYEALIHAGVYHNAKVEIKRVDSEDVSRIGAASNLEDVDGVLVPGGFGSRGIEGKIDAAKYARENKVPFLGICLGMQTAVIEFARNVCGMKKANSTEFDRKTRYPVISLIEEQKKVKDMGGTMRLGAYNCSLKDGTKSREAYKRSEIPERHRHRYEFNNRYRTDMAKKGLIVSGTYKKADLVEIVEVKGHPWFVACQFHPEFRSKPDKPHPLFRDLVGAALTRQFLRDKEE
ncbi:MAG: CTP synthase [Candidatus Omnitrophica bacterium]|nr:CTP synthase [Candidatus Omnitrophota bacterium]